MKTNPVPAGYQTVIPYLTVKGGLKLIDFLKQGLGAEEVSCHKTPDGTVMNAEVKIGDSIVMIGDVRGDQPPRQTMLYMYVQDCDALYRQAIKAGGKSIMEPKDQFYGDRSGAIEDPSGNQWWIASRKETLTNEELAKRAQECKG